MSDFAPSPYQQAVFDFVTTGTGSARVVAVAGSGKTTTVMQSLRFIPETSSVRILAFNASIAKELNARLDNLRRETGKQYGEFKASTFHALAFGQVGKYLAGKGVNRNDVRPDGQKLARLFRAMVPAQTAEMYSEFVTKLVAFGKGEGIGPLVPESRERWAALIQHHGIFLDNTNADEETAIGYASELLRESNKAALTGDIDFDDMLYMPLVWKLRLWQVDWVFIDEAQDTNPVRRALAALLLKPGGRLIAVGDPRQAIYGFTGASHDAMDCIARDFNAIELPLTVSYRCARKIVEDAQRFVSHIEAPLLAPEGSVETLSLKDTLAALTENDAVLCRNTAPLVALAYHLIGQGRGCRVAGREIGQGLIKIIKAQKARTLDDLEKALGEWASREIAKWTAKGEAQRAEGISDRAECIGAVVSALGEHERTVSGLIAKIEGLFSDDSNANLLTLSTVHKSKGREWDRVAILRPDLMPSKWARQEHQMREETNLRYVAATRAKSHLIYINGEVE